MEKRDYSKWVKIILIEIVTVKSSGCILYTDRFWAPDIIDYICNFFILPPLLQLIKSKNHAQVCLFHAQVCPY